MALVTRSLVYLDAGAFVVTYTYDDATLLIASLRAVNTGARGYPVVAEAPANGRTYTVSVPAGTEITQTIPQGAANRLQLSVRPDGRLIGVNWQAY